MVVSRVSRPLATSTTQRSFFLTYATREPSGEKAGTSSSSASFVRRRSPLPDFAETSRSQRSELPEARRSVPDGFHCEPASVRGFGASSFPFASFAAGSIGFTSSAAFFPAAASYCQSVVEASSPCPRVVSQVTRAASRHAISEAPAGRGPRGR